MRYFVFFMLIFSGWMQAANLQFRNLSVPDGNSISCEISWDHSWNLQGIAAPWNYDGVWIFVKYRQNGGKWQHMDLSASSADHNSANPALLAPEAVPDGKGLFIKRMAAGSGNNGFTQISIRFAQTLPGGNYDFRLFGIEMVHVSEGSFFLGDSLSNHTFADAENGSPFFIADENEIITGNQSGQLLDTMTYAPAGNIPAAWPKGYASFWCMKYELSQAQYRDFLNCLDHDQQAARMVADPAAVAGTPAMYGFGSGNRNGLAIVQPGSAAAPALIGCDGNANGMANEPDDGGDRAMNFISWADLAAYLDWAALRPMTEFEFEKLCRGPQMPVPLEFAWGTDSVADANTVVLDGTADESVSETVSGTYGLASHGYSGPQGSLRCGFPGAAAQGRKALGAGYFGATELSGNLWEQVVTVDAQGLLFTGTAGDGNLTTNGEADATGWPLADGTGAGHRGGGWNSGVIPGFRDLAVSDRFYAGLKPLTRRNTAGGRGMR